MNRENQFGQNSALLDIGALKARGQTTQALVFFPDRILVMLVLTALSELTAKFR